MVNIFTYTDYRAYLKDRCQELKGTSRTFSFRNFARAAGVASSGYLKMVMDGERGLTPETARRFASALKLDRAERAFFVDLVAFTQAKGHEERDRCCKKLATHRRFLKAQQLSKEQLDYFSHWYYAAIREMVHLRNFRDDPAWIARRLKPSISVAEAREALELLLRLGILARNERGRIVSVEQDLIVEGGVKSVAIMNYHRAMCLRAADALSSNRPADRNLISMTAAISRRKFHEVRERLETYRRELRELLAGGDEPEAVYQINLQLFHLTEVPDEA